MNSEFYQLKTDLQKICYLNVSRFIMLGFQILTVPLIKNNFIKILDLRTTVAIGRLVSMSLVPNVPGFWKENWTLWFVFLIFSWNLDLKCTKSHKMDPCVQFSNVGTIWRPDTKNSEFWMSSVLWGPVFGWLLYFVVAYAKGM